jgi:hypothetical protein
MAKFVINCDGAERAALETRSLTASAAIEARLQVASHQNVRVVLRLRWAFERTARGRLHDTKRRERNDKLDKGRRGCHRPGKADALEEHA